MEFSRAEKILAGALVLFLLLGGVKVLQELRQLPEEPSMMEYEAKYGIPALQENLSKLSERGRELEEAYRGAQEEFESSREGYLFLREEYRTSLEEGNLSEELKSKYEKARGEYQEALERRDAARERVEEVREEQEALAKKISGLRQEASEDYESARDIYEAKVFLLRLALVVPLLALSLYLSQRASERKSRHAILASSFMTFAILLFAYMIVEFTWRSFHVIGVSAIGALATGGALVYLKRKYFTPERVALGRLSERRCPHCDFPFEPGDTYCRRCGKKLTEECRYCGSQRSNFSPYCPHCGR